MKTLHSLGLLPHNILKSPVSEFGMVRGEAMAGTACDGLEAYAAPNSAGRPAP